RWDKSKPTIEGRRLIISMVVGGMTQYLTKVQGMPKDIEEKLAKRIKRFLWDEKTHVRINEQTVKAPITDGGRQVLDILARNEAIMLTWLQSYLDLSNDRATWTYIADALIAKHVPRAYENIDEMSKINIFLQSWKTNKKDLPKDLREMITTAKKHGLRLEGLAFSREIQRQMPIWFHSKATGMSGKHNHKLAKCLRQNHNVRTVRDA
ncbi:hypothetical protein EV361DRAFT_772279, partial [Lentinula raphanica]